MTSAAPTRDRVAAELSTPDFTLAEEEVLGERMQVFRTRMHSLRELLQTSQRHGEREYLVEGERRLTFAGHLRAVASTAALLRERHGIGRGDRVAILGANSLEWVLAFWAVTSLGAVAVVLNAWWSGEEIDYALRDAEPALLVADRARLERLLAPPCVPVCVMETDLRDLLQQGAGQNGAPALPDVAIHEDDPVVILYTSGTTGRPKGAVHSHRNVLGMVQIQAMLTARRPPPAGAPPPRVFTTSPLFHVSGLHNSIVANLASGATTVWSVGRFDPVAAMRTIERERTTTWSSVPTTVWRVVNHPDVGKYNLTSMAHIGGGGAAWSPSLQERVGEVFGARLTFGVGYGMTESTAIATVASYAELREHPTTVGRAMPTVEVEVRDADGRALPDGEEGEICVRGPLIMLGYWRNEAATAATLTAGRWLRTGDIGFLRDGLLFLSSRRTDLILRGGENVYPVEIENCLEGHPAVEECVVVGLPDEEWGQIVCAVVVPRAGAEVGEAALTAHVGEHLARFKVPSRWVFTAGPLPRTATGKVTRAAVLRDLTPS